MKMQLFSTVTILLITISLSGCGGTCGSFANDSYEVGDVQASVRIPDEEVTNGSSYLFSRPVPVDREVRAGQLLINIYTYQEVFAIWKRPIINVNLFEPAYACGLDPNTPWPTNRIEDIRITSNAQISPLHPAGEILNELFDVRGIEKSQSRNPAEYNSSDGTFEFYSLEEFLETSPFAAGEMQLHLNIRMPDSPVHEFTIEYALEGGLIWQITLPAITFVE